MISLGTLLKELENTSFSWSRTESTELAKINFGMKKDLASNNNYSMNQ